MARFLLVNQFYWPDIASTGQHLCDLAEHLAAAGHEVRVLCSKGGYLGPDGRELSDRELRAGVSIQRVRGLGFGQRTGLLKRALEYLAFHVQAARQVAFGGWADGIVTLTTPPLLGLWGRLAQLIRGKRHVAFVMDLHPDAEFALGLLRRRSLVGRLLEWANAWPLKHADRAVVLGPHMGARLIDKGVSKPRIHEIPVWTDGRLVRPLNHQHNPLRRQLGWDGRFVVLYSGNAGLVHRFDELLDAMPRVFERNPKVLFAFIGGGPRRAELERQVALRGLANAEFHDYLPREALGQSLPAADVHFLSLREEQAGIAVPGKLYGAMASGRPVLFLGPRSCESADTVRAGDCGYAFGYGEALALSEAILSLAESPKLCARLGHNARLEFERRYDTEVCLAQWLELLEGLLPGARRTPVPAEVGVSVGLDLDSDSVQPAAVERLPLEREREQGAA